MRARLPPLLGPTPVKPCAAAMAPLRGTSSRATQLASCAPGPRVPAVAHHQFDAPLHHRVSGKNWATWDCSESQPQVNRALWLCGRCERSGGGRPVTRTRHRGTSAQHPAPRAPARATCQRVAPRRIVYSGTGVGICRGVDLQNSMAALGLATRSTSSRWKN